MEIYQPAEDSYFLQEILKDFLKSQKSSISILDMGSGSGIQAKTCKNMGFENITTADINPDAVKELKKSGFKSIHTNLFENIKNKFDLIIFNPPYLPEDEREPEDSKHNTTAGKKGYEIIIEFLKQAKNHLSDNGTILLLFSSLSKPEIIKNQSQKLNFNLQILSKLNLSFEQLFVCKISLKKQAF